MSENRSRRSNLTPFEIELMKLYYSPNPLREYPTRQRTSNAMEEAVQRFLDAGWLCTDVSLPVLVWLAHNQRNRSARHLTPKGETLVRRICNTSLIDLNP